MLSTATLQKILDRTAAQAYNLKSSCLYCSSGISFFTKLESAGSDYDTMDDLMDGANASDVTFVSGSSVSSTIYKSAFGTLIAGLEAHARGNGYSNLNEWTSGLAASLSLKIDPIFGTVYTACRQGKSSNTLSSDSFYASGTRILVL